MTTLNFPELSVLQREAISFGYKIADWHARERSNKFVFISSPLPSSLPGLITLGAILRHQPPTAGRPTDLDEGNYYQFIRFWESGYIENITGPKKGNTKIYKLDMEYPPGKDRNFLRTNNLNQNNFLIFKKDGATFCVNSTNTSKYYNSNISNTIYSNLFTLKNEFSTENESLNIFYNKIFLATSKKNYEAYRNILSATGEQNLRNYLNLEQDTGTELNPSYGHNGAWLNSSRRNVPNNNTTDSICIFDGTKAWAKWQKIFSRDNNCQIWVSCRATRAKEMETSKNMLYDISTFLREYEYISHPWIANPKQPSDWHPIQAFLHKM